MQKYKCSKAYLYRAETFILKVVMLIADKGASLSYTTSLCQGISTTV